MKIYKNTDWQEIELNEEKKNIPTSWTKNNVKNSIYLKARIGWQGLKNSEFIKDGIFYCVTGQDFYNNEVNWNNCYKVTKDRYDQDTKIQLQKNDILITKDGTIGKFAKVTNIPNGYLATLNSGVFVSRAKNIQQNFWFYILKSNLFFDFVEKQKSGSTIAHLNQGKFENLEFLIPSDKEQTAIASILSTQESIVSKTKDLIAQLHKRNQFMMDELLSGRLRVIENNGQVIFNKNHEDNWKEININGETINIPKDWDSFKLKGNIDIKTGKKDANVAKTDGKYAFFTCGKQILKTDTYDFDCEAVLIAGNGDVGETKYYKGKFDAYQRTYVLSNFKYDLKFLFVYMNKLFKDSIEALGSAMPYIKLGYLENFSVNQPQDLIERQLLLKVITSFNEEKEKYEKILEKEEKAFTFLLEELMSGRLRIKI
jgi:type I restriction enzyme S subunit